MRALAEVECGRGRLPPSPRRPAAARGPRRVTAGPGPTSAPTRSAVALVPGGRPSAVRATKGPRRAPGRARRRVSGAVRGTRASSSARSRPATAAPCAPDDHGEVAPRDAVVDVEAPELARDRRVLLRRVGRAPRLDARIAWGARCGVLQLDVHRPVEHLGEPKRAGRPSCLGTRTRGPRRRRRPPGRARGATSSASCGERRLLVVVHEQVVEERRFRGRHRRLRSADQRREVHHTVGVEHIQVVAIEPSELVPTGEPANVGPRSDLLRGETSLLRSKQELTDLVCEPTEGEEVPVCGPARPGPVPGADPARARTGRRPKALREVPRIRGQRIVREGSGAPGRGRSGPGDWIATRAAAR